MIVPRYWAEARLRHRQDGRQITARRFGWSDSSQADAQASAEERVKEALARLVAGEKLEKTEPKLPYNGADGLPIREEILDQRGEAIVTRNSYGARCLNTPDVFFADIDFATPVRCRWRFWVLFALLAIAALSGHLTGSRPVLAVLVLLALWFHGTVARWFDRPAADVSNEEMIAARDRISGFLNGHPGWGLRIYQTPAGLRLLATHRPFDPKEPEVAAAFKAFRTDPLYQTMCFRQHCFRARVSPKPWRIGIEGHLRPRPGTWPIHPDRLPERIAWTHRYEQASQGFAACRFVESLGESAVHPAVLPVLAWHDELSRANQSLPTA